MKLSIIIVSYNTKSLTLACIKSIYSCKPNLLFEVIVVDNASTDGSVEALQKLDEKIVYIKSDRNLGFSKANNLGLKKAKGEYKLLLNSDTKLTTPIFEKLVLFAQEHPDAGIVSPRLLNLDMTTQGSIFRLPTLTRAIAQYWFGVPNLLDKYAITKGSFVEVESVVGAAFLITPQAQTKVGLLDEKYFMYFEDLDYCRRVRSQHLKIYYLPEITLIHHHGASGKSGVNSLIVDSSKKYFGIIQYYIYTFVLWSGQKLHHI